MFESVYFFVHRIKEQNDWQNFQYFVYDCNSWSCAHWISINRPIIKSKCLYTISWWYNKKKKEKRKQRKRNRKKILNRKWLCFWEKDNKWQRQEENERKKTSKAKPSQLCHMCIGMKELFIWFTDKYCLHLHFHKNRSVFKSERACAFVCFYGTGS